MTYIKALLTLFSALFVSVAVSQTETISSSSEGNEEHAMVSTEKTYTVNDGNKLIRHSVRISTSMTQEIALREEDQGKMDQERVMPKKTITKVVEIDNDEDDAYDELIRFSYKAHHASDFVLISNKDEILVALDDGEDLSIIENSNIAISGLSDPLEAYIFTDDNGEKIEFFIEEYKTMNEPER